jgi:hypothetical protein
MTQWARPFVEAEPPHRVAWWTIEAGLDTLAAWKEDPSLSKTPGWWGLNTYWRENVLEAEKMEVPFQGWNPQTETQAQFVARFDGMLVELKQWRQQHLAEMNSLVRRTPQKKSPHHYDWLALRLIRADLSYDQICNLWAELHADDERASNFSQNTVREGVITAARELLLRIP